MTKRTLTEAMQNASSPGEARADVPPSRRGKRVFPVYLDDALWRRFKMAAIARDVSMQRLILEALEDKLARG